MSAIGWGKLLYFGYFAAAAALAPTLTLYYVQRGLSGNQVGILAAMAPAGAIVGAAFWAGAADASGRHKLILAVTVVLAIGISQLFRIAGSMLWLVPVAFLFAFAAAPIIPVADSAVLGLLGDSRGRYGRVRLWGALGWGISAPLAGLVLDRYGLAASFVIYACLMPIVLVTAIVLPIQRVDERPNVFVGLGLIARDPRWLIFLGIALTSGIAGAFMHHYLFVFMDAIGANGFERGLALTAATVSEFFAFFFAHAAIRRFGSRNVLVAAIAAAVLRLAAYSVITAPVLVLLPQLLHGLTFSLFTVAGVTHAHHLAPKGLTTTAQALFNAVTNGIGGVLGALLGGRLYELVGVHSMYRVAAFISFAALVVFVAIGRWGRSRSPGV